SRGRFDAQIYTDSTAHLGDVLSRQVGKLSAIEASRAPEGQGQMVGPTSVGRQETPLVIER
ncbi:MAG: hypothetical protein ABL986_20120, partial [Vicinamibacterales bacterium]